VGHWQANELYPHDGEGQTPHERGTETPADRSGLLPACPFEYGRYQRGRERQHPPGTNEQTNGHGHGSQKILEGQRLPPQSGALPASNEDGPGQGQNASKPQDEECHRCIGPDGPERSRAHDNPFLLILFDVV
jgi:hypothetical protein